MYIMHVPLLSPNGLHGCFDDSSMAPWDLLHASFISAVDSIAQCSYADSGPASPAQPCEDVVQRHEHAASPVRLRPAQRQMVRDAVAQQRAAQAAERTQLMAASLREPLAHHGGSQEMAQAAPLRLKGQYLPCLVGHVQPFVHRVNAMLQLIKYDLND